MTGLRAAVFLDRDGVINANVFYPDSGEWEAPRRVEDYCILPRALDAMKRLDNAGYDLFLVSNQPNQAKRKATPEDHNAIHAFLLENLEKADIKLVESYYCFHHPKGIEPSLRGVCECRKPSPYFLFKARDDFGLDLSRGWMIGDRITDVECGKRAGVRTIRICSANNPTTEDIVADHQAVTLWEAVDHVLADC